MLTSLAKEEFPDAHRQLFDEGFEQPLKTRSETAKAASAGKPFFRRGASRGSTRAREGRQQFRGFRPLNTFQLSTWIRPQSQSGRGRGQSFRTSQPKPTTQ